MAMHLPSSFLIAALLVSPQGGAGQGISYAGVVRWADDSSAVQGAQVWLLATPYGTLTDSTGRFTLTVPRGQYPMVVRVCGQNDAGRTYHLTGTDSALNIVIALERPDACPQLARPPWAVGHQDSTVIEGDFSFSWEGNGVLICRPGVDVQYYRPWLSKEQEAAVRRRVPPNATMEGARVFVRLRGRLDNDPSTRNMSAKMFFVAEVLEAREIPQLSFKELWEKMKRECR